jgi:hypothetical protein
MVKQEYQLRTIQRRTTYSNIATIENIFFTTIEQNILEGQKPSRKAPKLQTKSILAANTQGMAAKGRETEK